jgi:outer membrane protein, heavy metal efflux system
MRTLEHSSMQNAHQSVCDTGKTRVSTKTRRHGGSLKLVPGMLLPLLALCVSACLSSHYTPQPVPLFMGEELASQLPKLLHEPASKPEESVAANRPDRVTLDQAIRECIEYNPHIRAVIMEIRAAQAGVREAGMIEDPELAIELGELPYNRTFTRGAEVPPELDFEIEWDLTWLLTGERNAEIRAARKEVDVAMAEHAEEVREHVAETIEAFIDVLEAQALLDFAIEDLDTHEQVRDAIARRVEIGDAPQIELDRVRISVMEARREVREIRAELSIARAELAALMGRPAGDNEFEVVGALDAADSSEIPDLMTLFDTASQNRPDIKLYRRLVELADAEVRVEAAGRLPGVAVFAGHTWEMGRAVGDSDEHLWRVGVGIGLPIFSGNRRAVQRARAEAMVARYELAARIHDSRAEVHSAWIELRSARELLELDDREHVELAESVRNRMRRAYELGAQSLLELLDAEEAYRDALRAELQGRAAYLRAKHALNVAVGTKVID